MANLDKAVKLEAIKQVKEYVDENTPNIKVEDDGSGVMLASSLNNKYGSEYVRFDETAEGLQVYSQNEAGEAVMNTILADKSYVEAHGGKIDTIKVNGDTQEIKDKTVDISMPSIWLNVEDSPIVGTDIRVARFRSEDKGFVEMRLFFSSDAEPTMMWTHSKDGDTKAARFPSVAFVETMIAVAKLGVLKPKGSVEFANLPALSEANLNKLYNVTDDFVSTADFIDGGGKSYPAGTNVAIINTAEEWQTPVYRYDAMTGSIDLSGLCSKEELEALAQVVAAQEEEIKNAGKIAKIKVNNKEQSIDPSDRSVNLKVPEAGAKVDYSIISQEVEGWIATENYARLIYFHGSLKPEHIDTLGLTFEDNDDSVDYTLATKEYVDSNIADKQDALTAGDGITIDNNTISADEVFIAVYGQTSCADVKAAIESKKVILLVDSNPSIPGGTLSIVPTVSYINRDDGCTLRVVRREYLFSYVLTSNDEWSVSSIFEYASADQVAEKQNTLVSGVNIKTINNQSLLGSGNIDINEVFVAVYEQTLYADVKAAIDAHKVIVLDMPANNNQFNITYSTYTNGGNALMYAIYKRSDNPTLMTATLTPENNWTVTHTDLQDKLISGTNLKTINNQSLLGSGNIDVSGGSGEKEIFFAYSRGYKRSSYQEVYDAARSDKVIYVNGYPSIQTIYGNQKIWIECLSAYIIETKPKEIKLPYVVRYECSESGWTEEVLGTVQRALVSGVSIKTINDISLLGEGNISIPKVIVDTAISDTSKNPVQNKVIKNYIDVADADIQSKLGTLTDLATTEKTNLVSAINEVNGKTGVNFQVGKETWYGTYTDENDVTYQVYTKTIYIPALPATAGITKYEHGVKNIKQILSIYGFTTDGFVLNAPRQTVSDNITIYQASKSEGNETFSIEVGKDRSSKKAYVTMVYAKNN